MVYAPLGPTHQAIEDISIMRTIPNMNIIAPCDSIEMKELITQTVKFIKGPLYIRLARKVAMLKLLQIKKIKFGKINYYLEILKIFYLSQRE